MVKAPGHNVGEPLPAVDRTHRTHLLGELLRGVSRSFYLTIRVLPGDLREPVGLAYLIARAADTIADTRLVPPEQRLEHLLALREQVRGPARAEDLRRIEQALTDKQSVPGERVLLSSLPQALTMLEESSQEDRDLIRWVVITLTQGMEIDLRTFPPEGSGRVVALKSSDELDRYVYYVAGCVGEFWTAITIAHTPALHGWDYDVMSRTGVGFGKALQLTNVLRDVPRDLLTGRCYLPEDELAGVGLAPEELLDTSSGSQARPVLTAGIHRALGHYSCAEEYLLAIPRRCVRLRLAALWPVLIGLATLARLAQNSRWLDPAHPSRVSRGWVYRMLARTWPAVGSNLVLRGWIGHLRRQVKAAL